MAIERRTTKIPTIEELQARIDSAADGEVICLGAGRIRGRLVIDKPVVLRGSGADRTTIDGTGRGAAIAVDATHGEVRIEELTITGGRSSFGAGISIDNGATVHVVGCTILRNAAKSGRGGAIAVERGSVFVTECTLVQNRAMMGGAIYVGGDAKVELAATIVAENAAVFGGGVAAVASAEIDVWTSRLLENQADYEGHHLYTYSEEGGRTRVVFSNAILSAADAAGMPISNHPDYKSEIVVDHSTIGRDRLPTCLFA